MTGMSGWWAYFTRQRKRRGLSQADVSRAMDIPSSTVSRWQTQAPSPDMLRRLAPILRQPVIRLFVEAGHLDPSDVDLPPEPAPADPYDTAEQAIEARTDLSRTQKDALLAMLRHLRGGSGGQAGRRPEPGEAPEEDVR